MRRGSSLAKRALSWGALCVVDAATVGCSTNATVEGPGLDAAVAIFPPAFKETGFRQVRPCRAPGEHSALNGFTVWADDASAAQYDALLAGSDAGVHEMPSGSLVIKELYLDRSCGSVDHWVAMKKIPGYDPPHGDWMWQDMSAQGTSTTEGRVAACFGCHTGGDTGTCAGYGAAQGMDYLCTAP